MSLRPYLIYLLLVGAVLTTQAQTPCTDLGQNPSTAFPVCGTATFTQNTVALCGGVPIPGPCASSDPITDVNPYWYRFTCYVSGTLSFLITPNNLSDDYDWQIFDVTGRNVIDVYTDASLFVACNWSGFSGVTGATAAGTSLANCAGNYPLISKMPTLIAGHDYLLLVSHWTSTQSGYQLSFTMGQTGGGTAAITDPANPIPLVSSASVNCDATQIVVRFSKKLKCNTLAGDGSDFTLSPSGTIISIAGYGCTSGFQIDSVFIGLSAPLAPGNYTIAAVNGSDGNTLLDNCDRAVIVGDNAGFTVNPPAPLPMGNVAQPPCAPVSLTITFADPLKCSSIAANGSDFTITGPSAVTISGATAINCNGNGETNSINVQLSSPIITPGNYQINAATGSDGNSLVGECNRQVTTGAGATFNIATQPPIAMGTVDPVSCSPSSLVITFAENILCSSIAANGSDFIVTGQPGITVTGATANCNNGETNSITVQLSAPITVSGNYQLQMVNGSDNNTLVGNCYRNVSPGVTTSFTVPPASPVAMDSMVPVACSPSALKLIFASPIKCSSIAGDGSDFMVTGPSTVAISAANGTCDQNGLTTSIDIRLTAPIVMGGSYSLQLKNGNDGNTLLSDCNRATPVGSSKSFAVSDTVSALFQYQVQYDCTTDVVRFSHDGQHNVNQWNWMINGTAAGTAQSFTHSFSSSSQNQIQLTVSNGTCSDSYTLPLAFNNKVVADFNLPETVCPEDTVAFKDKTVGQADFWQWDFGNGNSSVLQNPPAQIYPLTGSEQIYTINFTDGNSACQSTVTKTIKVLSGCVIAVPSAFTPNNDGKNDYLYPANALKAENLDFKVFNRWGQLLFHSRDWTWKWDGTINGIKQATGVYVWMLDYDDKDTHRHHSLKGMTTLIR